VLDPVHHAHGKWCLEVVRALGLLPEDAAACISMEEGSDPSEEPAAQPAAQAAGAQAVPAPLHTGISLGGSMLLDLAVVEPSAIGGAALVVPGGMCPGQAWVV